VTPAEREERTYQTLWRGALLAVVFYGLSWLPWGGVALLAAGAAVFAILLLLEEDIHDEGGL
jgi:asparagine N-glycosylation enzyme membrane subunit Stt3